MRTTRGGLSPLRHCEERSNLRAIQGGEARRILSMRTTMVDPCGSGAMQSGRTEQLCSTKAMSLRGTKQSRTMHHVCLGNEITL
jgi:hypothetical protein